MRAMAYKLFSSMKSHPLITAISVLLLFTLPIFHLLMFFWPLIVSTVLGVLAVVSFGRQSDEHSTLFAGCGAAGASQPDIAAVPSHQEKISNVLMVGNQEVTWLEWLHNEDTEKLCAHKGELAVWDAYECDGSSMVISEASGITHASWATGDASSGSTCKDEAIDEAKDMGRLYAVGAGGQGEMPVSALVSAEKDETRAVVLPSTGLDGFGGPAIVGEDVNKVFTAEDETNLNSTGEDRMGTVGRMKQKGIVLTVNGESNARCPPCAEGDEDQMSVEGLCLTGRGGNDCKTMQGSIDSTVHSKNEMNGYASAGGDKVVGNLEAASKCNIVANSCVSTIGIQSTLSKYVSEGEISLHVASATLEESGMHAPEFLSAAETISHPSEPKKAHTHGHDAIYEGSNQFDAQDPQWDVSDGEEDRSSLRFSFFHNTSHTSSEA